MVMDDRPEQFTVDRENANRAIRRKVDESDAPEVEVELPLVVYDVGIRYDLDIELGDPAHGVKIRGRRGDPELRIHGHRIKIISGKHMPFISR